MSRLAEDFTEFLALRIGSVKENTQEREAREDLAGISDELMEKVRKYGAELENSAYITGFRDGVSVMAEF